MRATAAGLTLSVVAAASCAVVTPLASAALFDVHSLAIAPDGARLYAGQGLGTPYAPFARDASTGRLSFLPAPSFSGTGGGSAAGEFRNSIAVSPDSKAVYDSVNGADTLRQMTVTDDSLAPAAAYVNYQGGITGMTGPQVVQASPDGNCVYVTAVSSYPGSIVAFRRDPATNNLTYASTYTDPNAFPYAAWDQMAFSADGRFLYSAAGTTGLVTLGRDAQTCQLTTGPAASVGGTQLTALAIDPSSTTLYAADPLGKQLVVFSRDATTGDVAVSRTLTEGVGGVHGLDGVGGVVVSPDGKNVYTAADSESSLDVWDRDPVTGQLTLRSVIGNSDAVEGALARAKTLVISPDGGFVYVGAAGPGAVSVFQRDATTGDLTFVQAVTQGDAPVDNPLPPRDGSGGGIPGGGDDAPHGPKPPPGRVGVSIDAGALYTNNPNVTLSVVWPSGTFAALLSNDGGFGQARQVSVAARLPWKLSSTGPERLPKTVYLRFGSSTQTFTDDIILDQTPPTLQSAVALAAPSSSPKSARSGAVAASANRHAYAFRLRGRDRTSGVASMQFAVQRNKPMGVQRYKPTAKVISAKPPLWVRIRDRAGNFSRWRRLAAAAPKRPAASHRAHARAGR
ncbi:MAG TPA: beta-propeller fold lactonase family protein [Conexibacter sp.]